MKLTRSRAWLVIALGLMQAMTMTTSHLSAQEKDKDSLFDTESRTFLVLPLVINNPSFKTGLGVLPMYFFKLNREDKLSPPSMATVFTLYSTNKSYAFIPSARLFWNEDKNRMSIFGGPVRINQDFLYDLGEGNEARLVFSEIRSVVYVEYSRKVFGDFYLGALYMGMKTDYRFDQGTEEENEFTRAFFEENGIEDNFVSSIGLNLSFDNRDYVYYPSKGWNVTIRPKLYRSWLGSENDYTDTDYNIAYFHPLSTRDILAFSADGGFATGDVPFDGYQSYGSRNNLRGYPGGKYRGENMVAIQAEWRRNLYKRWGGVLFAGTGSVWGNSNSGEEAFEREWLPSAGLGVRYMVSLQKKINIRLDYAIGVDGNQGLYFGIMEAF